MVNVGRYRFDKIAELFQFVAAVLLALVVFLYFWCAADNDDGPDAVVLTKAGAVTAQWNYQQLPMHECKWCGRTVNLNRHHAVPQAANPALRDVKENLIVLCRDCHFVLGHRCNWKQYNPDVMYIATHFTNCVRSADTRAGLEKPDGEPFTTTEPEKDWRTTVTNRESLNEAIDRLFASGVRVQYKERLDSDEDWHELSAREVPTAMAQALIDHVKSVQESGDGAYCKDVLVTGDGKIRSEVYGGIKDGTEGKHTD